MSYCKFHPEAEAVTKCAVCGADLCSICNKDAFYIDDEKQPFCLECSLKEAEKDLADKKAFLKMTKKDGGIGVLIWFAGIVLGGILMDKTEVLGTILSFVSMFGGALFFLRSALFLSTEKDFFDRLKSVFWKIILNTLFLPIVVIFFLISDKIDIARANKKVKEIKTKLGIEN